MSTTRGWTRRSVRRGPPSAADRRRSRDDLPRRSPAGYTQVEYLYASRLPPRGPALPPMPTAVLAVLALLTITTGTVRDAATGLPLAGVVVQVMGEPAAAPVVTDSAGRFSLDLTTRTRL